MSKGVNAQSPDPVEASNLDARQSGIVCGFTDDCLANKYMCMGVVPGSRVQLLRRSNGGATCCLNIDGRVLALRRSEAACLLIQCTADRL